MFRDYYVNLALGTLRIFKEQRYAGSGSGGRQEGSETGQIAYNDFVASCNFLSGTSDDWEWYQNGQQMGKLSLNQLEALVEDGSRSKDLEKMLYLCNCNIKFDPTKAHASNEGIRRQETDAGWTGVERSSGKKAAETEDQSSSRQEPTKTERPRRRSSARRRAAIQADEDTAPIGWGQDVNDLPVFTCYIVYSHTTQTPQMYLRAMRGDKELEVDEIRRLVPKEQRSLVQIEYFTPIRQAKLALVHPCKHAVGMEALLSGLNEVKQKKLQEKQEQLERKKAERKERKRLKQTLSKRGESKQTDGSESPSTDRALAAGVADISLDSDDEDEDKADAEAEWESVEMRSVFDHRVYIITFLKLVSSILPELQFDRSVAI